MYVDNMYFPLLGATAHSLLLPPIRVFQLWVSATQSQGSPIMICVEVSRVVFVLVVDSLDTSKCLA